MTANTALSHGGLRLSTRRVGAIILRHLYVLKRSWPRILELAYWPTVQMILWGFVTTFFLQNSSWVAQAAGVLISAVLPSFVSEFLPSNSPITPSMTDMSAPLPPRQKISFTPSSFIIQLSRFRETLPVTAVW